VIIKCLAAPAALSYTSQNPQGDKVVKVSLMCKRLVEDGFTQKRIAEMVQDSGVVCPPSQISRIIAGRDPSYTLGDAIRRVYFENSAKEHRQ